MEQFPGPKLPDAIALAVLEEIVRKKPFPQLDDHMLESPVNNNHVYQLIKSVIKSFVRIRFHHLGKEANQLMLKN